MVFIRKYLFIQFNIQLKIGKSYKIKYFKLLNINSQKKNYIKK